MERTLSALPIILFGIVVVFKFIFSQSYKLFFNLGRIRRFGVLEIMDFIFLCVSAFVAIRFSLHSDFNNTLWDWTQITIPVILLYRFLYIGTTRLIVKKETIFDNLSAQSFFND